MRNLFFRLVWFFLSCLFLFTILLIIFMPIFTAQTLIFPYAITPFDICKNYPQLWSILKKLYWICFFISYFIIYNYLYNNIQQFFKYKSINNTSQHNFVEDLNSIHLLVGKNSNNIPIYISEKGLYQNILITGTIGSR